MPAYLLRGFRWHRASIRVYVVLANVDEASSDWVMGPNSSAAIINSFREALPVIAEENVDLRLIEQHDEHDLGEQAIAQPFAFVADQFVRVGLSVDVEEALRVATGKIGDVEGEGSNLEEMLAKTDLNRDKNDKAGEPSNKKDESEDSEAAQRKRRDAAFVRLRDGLAPREKIAWYVVWCGDEVRCVHTEGVIRPPDLGDVANRGQENTEDSVGDAAPTATGSDVATASSSVATASSGEDESSGGDA